MADRAQGDDAAVPCTGRYRFFVAEAGAAAGILDLRGDLAHRIARVLRLPRAALVDVFDGSGRLWPATLDDVRPAAVRLTLGTPSWRAAPPTTELLAALIRPSRFEWLVEKATELGATAIRPMICARSAVRPAEIGAARLDRWRRIAIEAAEQCGRATVPEIAQPAQFSQVLAGAAGRLFLAAEPDHGPAVSLGIAAHDIEQTAVSVLVGPEGGFTAEEVAAAIAAGATPVSLGPSVLRAETAALAALSVIADARAGRSPRA